MDLYDISNVDEIIEHIRQTTPEVLERFTKSILADIKYQRPELLDESSNTIKAQIFVLGTDQLDLVLSRLRETNLRLYIDPENRRIVFSYELVMIGLKFTDNPETVLAYHSSKLRTELIKRLADSRGLVYTEDVLKYKFFYKGQHHKDLDISLVDTNDRIEQLLDVHGIFNAMADNDFFSIVTSSEFYQEHWFVDENDKGRYVSYIIPDKFRTSSKPLSPNQRFRISNVRNILHGDQEIINSLRKAIVSEIEKKILNGEMLKMLLDIEDKDVGSSLVIARELVEFNNDEMSDIVEDLIQDVLRNRERIVDG